MEKQKLKTVNDICKITNLTRKLVNDYKDVVKATSYYGSGKYKIYDDEAVEKYNQIALFRELGFKRKKIKEIFSDPACDRAKVIDELIEELNEEKKIIENRILVAKELKLIGFNNIGIDEFHDRDINLIAEKFEATKDTEMYKLIIEKDKKLSQKDKEKYYIILKGFLDLKNERVDAEVVKEQVEKLADYFAEYYGLFEPKFLLFASCIIDGGGEASQDISDCVGIEVTKFISEAIGDKIFNDFMNEFSSMFEKFEKAILKNEIEEKYKELLCSIERLFENYFSINFSQYPAEIEEMLRMFLEDYPEEVIKPFFEAVKKYKKNN